MQVNAMKLEKILSGAKALALASILPVLAHGQTYVSVTNSTVTDAPLQGVASTSANKLGLSNSAIYTYNANLTSAIGEPKSVGTSINDAGSWNDIFYLTLSAGVVDKNRISDNVAIDSVSLPSSTLAVSSIFNYQGTDSFAAVASDGNVKLYNWGNPTPVATLYNAGANVTGLDVRVSNTSGVVNNLNTDLQIFTTKSDNTFNYTSATGTLIGGGSTPGVYALNSVTGLTDVAYNNGILTLSVNNINLDGALYNVNFSSYQTAAVPEPATTGLIAGALGLLGALGYKKLKKKGINASA